jgi:hypothetical protein
VLLSSGDIIQYGRDHPENTDLVDVREQSHDLWRARLLEVSLIIILEAPSTIALSSQIFQIQPSICVIYAKLWIDLAVLDNNPL